MEVPYKKLDEDTDGVILNKPPAFLGAARAANSLSVRGGQGESFRFPSQADDLDETTFLLADGSPTNAYGFVEFEKPRSRPPARYIRLSHETPAAPVMRLVIDRWRVPEPKVLISITGAAQGFTMQPHVHDVVNQGLVNAAKQTSAWLVTGGTDTGVMKLVGDAVRKLDVDVPVIGVTAWRAIHGREQLEHDEDAAADDDDDAPPSAAAAGKAAEGGAAHAAEGDVDGQRVCFYRRVCPDDWRGAALNANHTHFIMVDAPEPSGAEPGQTSGFGGEIEFRMKFERACRDRLSVPTVVVVLNGGVGSLAIIQRAVEDATPVILIRDSGGIARTLSHYLHSGTGEVMIDRVGDGSSYLVPPAREVAGADGRIDDGKLQAWTAKIRNEMEKIKLLDEQPGRHCIHSFSVRSASGVVANLDLALLKAIVFDSREQLARRWVGAAASEGVDGLHGLENVLMLAIEWGSREIVHHLLMSSLAAPPSAAAVGSGAPRRLSASSGAAEQAARYAELLASALQLALRKKHAPIVDLLLERDARPTGVDVFGLWADPAVTQFHRFSLDARARLLRGAEPPTPKRGMKLNTVQAVAVEAMQAHAKGDWNPATLHARRSSVATLAHFNSVAKFLTETYELPGGLIWPGWVSDAHFLLPGGTNYEPRWAVKDLFFWCIFNPVVSNGHDGARSGTDHMARTLWRYCDQPIREALVASHMASKLARVARLGPEEYHARAREFERWAVGILEQCSEAEARLVLQAPFEGAASGSLAATATPMHLAIRLERKTFLAHAHAQTLLDAWWRGDSRGYPGSPKESGVGGWCVARQPPAHFRTLLIHALSAGTSRLVRMEPSSVSNLDAASFGGVGVGVPPMPPSTGGRAAQLACFYAAPCTKFVLRMVCYQLFLVLYAGVLIFDDGTPDFDMVEVAFYAFAVGYAFDELHQLIEAWDSGRSHFDDEGWNLIDAAVFWVLFPIVLVMRLHALAFCPSAIDTARVLDAAAGFGDGAAQQGEALQRVLSEVAAGSLDINAWAAQCPQLHYSRTVLALTSILCFFRFLANYRVARELGELIYIIRAMVTDVFHFVQILAVVMCGFAFAFGGLAPPRQLRLETDADSPFMLPLWNLFDMSDVEEVASRTSQGTSMLALGVLSAYLFIAQILLVNLLIAMMSASFTAGRAHTLEQWAASRAAIIEELQLNFAVPPPFSAPFLLIDLGRRFALRARRRKPPPPPAANINRRRSLAALGGRRKSLAPPPGGAPGGNGDPLDANAALRARSRRTQLRYLRAFVEAETLRAAGSTDSRVDRLLAKSEQITSMLESAEAERALARSKLDEHAQAIAELRRERSWPAATPTAPPPAVARDDSRPSSLASSGGGVADTRRSALPNGSGGGVLDVRRSSLASGGGAVPLVRRAPAAAPRPAAVAASAPPRPSSGLPSATTTSELAVLTDAAQPPYQAPYASPQAPPASHALEAQASDVGADAHAEARQPSNWRASVWPPSELTLDDPSLSPQVLVARPAVAERTRSERDLLFEAAERDARADEDASRSPLTPMSQQLHQRTPLSESPAGGSDRSSELSVASPRTAAISVARRSHAPSGLRDATVGSFTTRKQASAAAGYERTSSPGRRSSPGARSSSASRDVPASRVSPSARSGRSGSEAASRATSASRRAEPLPSARSSRGVDATGPVHDRKRSVAFATSPITRSPTPLQAPSGQTSPQAANGEPAAPRVNGRRGFQGIRW